MARVKRADTEPELAIRRMLHARGWRYKINVRELPGTPDLVFPRLRAVIFVHGCFWHGHDCKLGRLPGTRADFWAKKIADNRSRDDRKVAQLEDAGWKVLSVWQCGLDQKEQLLSEIEAFLGNR